MKAIVPVVVFGFTTAASANVYGPHVGGAIPDNQNATCTVAPSAWLTSVINIPDGGTVASLNTVTLVMNHTWVGDLVITLTAPDGDNVHIIARPGPTGAPPGSSANVVGTYVFQNAPTVPTFSGVTVGGNGTVPTGTYGRETTIIGPPSPDPDNFTVFNGDPVTGNWTLRVEDWCQADFGTLTSWSLDITVSDFAPCAANIITTGASANQVDLDDLMAVIDQWGPCPGGARPARARPTSTPSARARIASMWMISCW